MTRGEAVETAAPVSEDSEGYLEGRAMLVAGKPMAVPSPRISAFIWGGKVRPQPTLPFGRWKEVA